MKHITFSFLVLFSFCMTNAQICYAKKNTVIGKIINEWGTPLDGANIIVKGTDRGVVSTHGDFVIIADQNDVLEISYVGYNTKEIIIGKEENFQIVLEMETLDEVLVTAYGKTLRRYSVTCSGCYLEAKVSFLEKDLNDDMELKNIKLFPNPSRNGYFNVSINDETAILDIVVISMSGQVIMNKKYDPINRTMSIDLSAFQAGVYIINIIKEGELLETKRAVKL